MRWAFEKRLDEGWSLWRVAYSAGSLMIAIAAATAYITHPHRFTSWLTLGFAVVALWEI